jgi:hypothetical protein
MRRIPSAAILLAAPLMLAAPAAAGGLALGDIDPLHLELPAQDEAMADGPISAGTRFYARLAGWYTMLDTTLQYGTSLNSAPLPIDLEDTLGLDTDLLTLRGNFGFHIADRFHLDFGINGPFNYDEDSGNTSFTFGDFSYNGSVHSEIDFVTFDADFAYDLVKEQDFRFWLGAGVRAMAISIEIQGQATDQNGNPVGNQTEEVDAGVGIPVVGLGIRWDMSRNFYFAAKGMGLYVGNYGNAYDASAELGWDFAHNFGLFAGFRFTHFEADIDQDDLDFEIDSDLLGPYAGVEVRF